MKQNLRGEALSFLNTEKSPYFKSFSRFELKSPQEKI